MTSKWDTADTKVISSAMPETTDTTKYWKSKWKALKATQQEKQRKGKNVATRRTVYINNVKEGKDKNRRKTRVEEVKTPTDFGVKGRDHLTTAAPFYF
jgi:hypothetical protein